MLARRLRAGTAARLMHGPVLRMERDYAPIVATARLRRSTVRSRAEHRDHFVDAGAYGAAGQGDAYRLRQLAQLQAEARQYALEYPCTALSLHSFKCANTGRQDFERFGDFRL